MSKIITFPRPVNGVVIEQRQDNGFINGTAMCTAHGKNIADWFRNHSTIELLLAVAEDLGVKGKYEISHNSSIKSISRAYPSLVLSKQGSPENGGGTWLHYDLAVQLAQWCNKVFAIQVSRWVREWFMTGRNPVEMSDDQRWAENQRRYDIRIYLKDVLRPALMNLVVCWAEEHGQNPRTLCSEVHDAMNIGIQGVRSKQIIEQGAIPLGHLARDYYGVLPLLDYSGINKVAINAVKDEGLHPVDAVYEACRRYLGQDYQPKLVPIQEHLHQERRRLKAAQKRKALAKPNQLSLFDQVS